MGSLRHPKLFDPVTIESVRDVFHDVLHDLKEHDALLISAHEQALKAEIIERLLELVNQGTPQHEWKAQVLATMLPR
jgi:hypothetical protein